MEQLVPALPDFALIVGFGSDMGSAEDAAMAFAEAAGHTASAIELNQIALADLQSATHFIVVTSTFVTASFPTTRRCSGRR